MIDSITVMRARSSRLLMCKQFMPDGSCRDYDDVKHYDAETLPVGGFDDLLCAVRNLMPQSGACVVRGELIGPTRRIERRIHPDKETGAVPTLRDVPRQWLALDTDSIMRPEHLDPADLEACADEVFPHLPPVFGRTTCIVVASSNHGIKPTIRLRLWFYCDRPLAGDELKRWLRGCPLDMSVFSAAQAIYTATPIFKDGRTDPLKTRLAVLAGEDWLRCPTAEELAPPPRPAPTPPQRIAQGDVADAYARGALVKAADAIINAGTGNRHRTICVEASNMARLISAGLLTSNQVERVLRRAAEQAGKDDGKEIALAIAWGLKNPAAGNLPEAR